MLPGIVSNERVALIRVELTRALPLYSYLEFRAKRLCGEAGIRGADGDEFATEKWELASCQCPHPRTIAGGIEEQPDERLNDRHFPPTRQAELRTLEPSPASLSAVMSSPALLNCSRRAASLGMDGGSSPHHPTTRGTAHDVIGH